MAELLNGVVLREGRAMSEKLPAGVGDAKSGEVLGPVSEPISPQLEILIKFEKSALSRIPEDLTVEEFERKRMAILIAFISNGYFDEISGICEGTSQTLQIASP